MYICIKAHLNRSNIVQHDKFEPIVLLSKSFNRMPKLIMFESMMLDDIGLTKLLDPFKWVFHSCEVFKNVWCEIFSKLLMSY